MVKKKIMPFGICSFISLSLVLSFSPVLADNAYTLTETTSDDKSENVIVKYEYDNNTGLLTPKYYRVNLNKTEYGAKDGNQTISVDSKYSSTGKIDYKYNSVDTAGFLTQRRENPENNMIEIISGGFFGANHTNNDSVYGGAIYNQGTINNINSDFIQNYVLSQESHNGSYGGAINNKGIIGNINGNFIANYTNGDTWVGGGAIYNTGTINNINGNFIENFIIGESIIQGGAIYNENIITNISGDFVNNYVLAEYNSSPSAYGGAIYNYGDAHISSIIGNYIGNSANAIVENDYANAYGGAISNGGNYTGAPAIEYIEGNFINNRVTLVATNDEDPFFNSRAYGGAIESSDYDTLIGIINGNFISNYVNAHTEYNEVEASGGAIEGNIGNINGDFVSNYAESTSKNSIAQSQGGAINGSVTEMSGNFIKNYAKAEGKNASAGGGAISGSGAKLNGDFIQNYASAVSELGNADASGGAINGYFEEMNSNFIANYVEANSTIKDADVATESSNYIKYQILQQSTATLLATANQMPSIALNLI